MGIGIGVYVKNSADAVKLYCDVFGLTLGYNVKNPDGSFFHSELNRNGEPFLSVVEAGERHTDTVAQLGVEMPCADDVKRAFELLSAGGKVDLPLGALPWSDCACSVIDQYGVWWYVSASSHRPPADYDYWDGKPLST